MISAFDYYQNIVRPTVEEFCQDNRNVRKGMLACMVTLHVVDYVMQNKANTPKEGNTQIAAFKSEAREKSFALKVVEGFALASKHCNLTSREGFDSGSYHVAVQAFWGKIRFGHSYWNGKVGGITIKWSEHGRVNLTKALKSALLFLEDSFPELVNKTDSASPTET